MPLHSTTTLIPMDARCLQYLQHSGGSVPTIAIPSRLFSGQIPEGHPSLVDLGLIEHRGDLTTITDAGRAALAGATA